MSFGFSVGDFLAVGTLTLRLYRAFKDAPAEFNEISGQLSSFHIVLCDLKDQADDPNSLLNRHGAPRRADLIETVNNMLSTLRELEDLYSRYEQMGRRPWLRMQLGQEQLSTLREKLTMHIGLINQFTVSLTVRAVGRMEPMIARIYQLLQEGVRSDRRKAETVRSAHDKDTLHSWEALELELRTEGIPVEYIQQNKRGIKAVLDEVVEAEHIQSGSVDSIEAASKSRQSNSIQSLRRDVCMCAQIQYSHPVFTKY